MFNLFNRKITLEKIIKYVEEDLEIKLDHESCCSKYYRIGKITLRISDHLQDRTKECIGLSVVDGTAIINVFRQVITINTFKEIKFFLWSLISLYNGEQLNEIYKKLIDSQHRKEITLVRDLVTKELTKKYTERESSLKQNYKNEINSLKTKNENLTITLSQKENQILSLHKEVASLNKEIAYLNKARSSNTKKKISKKNIANIKKELQNSDDKEIVETLLDVSNYLDKFPEELQSKILNIIGNYY